MVKKQTETKFFLSSSFIVFLFTLLASLFNYLFHLYVGRKVSVQTFGEIQSLIALFTIFSIPTAALTMLATKFSAKHYEQKDPQTNYSLWSFLNQKSLVIGVPLLLLLILLTPFVSGFLKITDYFSIILVWFVVFATTFSTINLGILNGWHRFIAAGQAGLWGTIAKLAGVMVLIHWGWQLKGTILAYLIAAGITWIFSQHFLQKVMKKNHKHLNGDEGEKIKRAFVTILLANFVLILLTNTDVVAAKHFLSADEAGFYGALSVTAKIIMFATGAITSVFFYISTVEYHQKKPSQASLIRSVILLSILCAISLAGYYFFPRQLLELLFGTKYLSGANNLIWFAILAVFQVFVTLFLNFLVSRGRDSHIYAIFVLSLGFPIGLLIFGKSLYTIIITSIAFQLVIGLASLYLIVFQSPKVGSSIQTCKN